MTRNRARIIDTEVPLSTGLSSALSTPDSDPGLRFVSEVLSLPRAAPVPCPTAPDLATAVAWLARVPLDRVRALLARYEISPDEAQAATRVTPRVLETLYEAVAWSDGASPFDTRKAQGSFHTPVQIVEAMVRDALDACLEAAPAALGHLRIVDPSVGPGAFLEGALRTLRARRQAAGLDPEPPPGTLCGVDISPLAIDVCRLRLALAGHEGADLRVGNSLVDDATFAWRTAWADGFDLVIGNPPYLRDSQKKNLDADALKRAYRAATSHYDLYVLFMERALEIARPGGVVCLLTSDRWLAQKYGRGIRGVLTENRLRGVLDLRFQGFSGAAVHTSITLAHREPAPPEQRTVLDTVDDLGQLGSILAPGRPSVRQAELDDGPFRFHVDHDERALGEQIRQRGRPLADFAFVSLGMVFHDPRPGGKRKADYVTSTRGGRFTRLLLDGEHVGRWRAEGASWLDYQPDEHREPRFPEMFAAAKVLCRRIIGRGRIMAMADDDQRFFSDNVVGVIPYHAIEAASSRTARQACKPRRVADSRLLDVHFVAALLNSRLIDWYYQKLLGFGMHLYPAHLKTMPIVVPPPDQQAALAALARRAASCAAPQPDLERRIDALVYDLYGLSEADRRRIGNTHDEHDERESADLDG